jgi:glycosyltransferase involved in cell wall biosynthesis
MGKGLESGDTRPTVLIIEENAHLSAGHFPVRFAQLAEGYAEFGYRVEVLTTWGWNSATSVDTCPFVLHSFGWTARQARRIAGRLRSLGEGNALRRFGRSAGEGLALLALVSAARARRRHMNPAPDAIVILGWDTEPALVAAMAGPGRWLLNQFRGPKAVPHWRSRLVTRCVAAAARRAERRRRAAGGCFRVAAANDTWRKEWASLVPFLDPIALPIAGVRPMQRAADARARLGLHRHDKIALLFGADHRRKHPQVAIDAFEHLEGWTVVIAGTIADRVEVPTQADATVVRFPGHIDDATRDLLLSAADLMILSFLPGSYMNSGTLMDAISMGVPVVCSAESAAAEIVERYRLGMVFAPGDAVSLADAVRHAPDHIGQEDLSRAQDERSNRAVARGQLLALGFTHILWPDGSRRA